jgi:hypothetical protein
MELLEREPFLTEFDRLLVEAAAGQGRLVFVGGEAGVGKTALAPPDPASVEPSYSFRFPCGDGRIADPV